MLTVFLIVGMSVFTKQDALSAGITSGLTVLAGFSVNMKSNLETGGTDSDIKLIVDGIVTEYRKSTTLSAGISLDDKLETILS